MTSLIFFLILPFVLQCAKLQQGTEKFPSASDLIKAFLKEAHKHTPHVPALSPAVPLVDPPTNHKAILRASALTQLAARVVQLLDLSVEDIEHDIPIKHQRQLLDAAAASNLEYEYARKTLLLMSYSSFHTHTHTHTGLTYSN